MKRIKPIQPSNSNERDLRNKYEEIYRDSDVWLYTKSHGVHSVILAQIKDYLVNKKVLDIGCGAGRLAIMCAHFGKNVDAFDFSRTAIFLAQKNAECSGTKNVNFVVSDIDNFSIRSKEKYDLITLVGVLEHVKNPMSTFGKLNSLLKKDGILIVSCPNFINFRGDSYMTLLTLFGLPMSLADLRQIDYRDIKKWSVETGFELQRTIGAIYKFGWDEKSINDMIKRVPLAINDKQLSIEVNYESYNSWLKSRREVNQMYLDYLEKEGILKKINRFAEIPFTKVECIDESLWRKMKKYIQEDIESDPYYCDTEPFCFQGGEGIYFLQKKRDLIA